jgi:hypothetical protein
MKKREALLMKAMFSIKDNSTSEECWSATRCMFDRLYSEEPSHHKLCTEDSCLKTFLGTCPEILYIPNYPILFGDTYIAVEKSHLKEMVNNLDFHFYICYSHYSHYDASLNIISKIQFNNRTCFKDDHFGPIFYLKGETRIIKYYKLINATYIRLNKYRYFFNYTSTVAQPGFLDQWANFSCVEKK